MADFTGGRVKWIIDADDAGFTKKVTASRQQVALFSKELKAIDFRALASDASSAFGSIANGLSTIGRVAATAGVAGSFGIGAMTKAAFDQVRQVENASFALRAYERDGEKVNKVLSELVAFARSDLGVLFQRDELFKAASNLRAFGESSDKLTDRIKVLARGVALGTTTFDELSLIVGRSAQAGKLTAEAYDQLAFRGIVLNSSLRGASVSADQLFEALSKALPQSILEGRANTIDGVLTRLKSSFRDLGSAILGVDKDTSTFIAGGAGDKLVKLLQSLRNIFAGAKFKETFAGLGRSIAGFAEDAIPKLISGLGWVIDNRKTVVAALAAIAVAFTTAKLAAIGFAIAAAATPLGIIAGAVVALAAAITFLQVRFQLFTNLMQSVKPVLDPIVAIFRELFRVLGEQLAPVIEFVSRNFEIFRVIGLSLLGLVLLPIGLAIGVLVGAFAALVGAIDLVLFVFNKVMSVGGRVIGIFIDLSKGIATVSSDVAGFFRDLPGKIIGWIGDAGSILFNVGRNIIQGLINGIKDKFNDVKDTLGDLTSKLTDWKGPESLDKVILRESGQLVIGGFVDGLESKFGDVQSSLGSLTDSLAIGRPNLAPDVISGSELAQVDAQSGRIEQNNTFNVYQNVDLTQGLRDIAWQLGN